MLKVELPFKISDWLACFFTNMFFIGMSISRPDIAKSSTFVDKTCTLIEQSNAEEMAKQLRVLPVLL